MLDIRAPYGPYLPHSEVSEGGQVHVDAHKALIQTVRDHGRAHKPLADGPVEEDLMGSHTLEKSMAITRLFLTVAFFGLIVLRGLILFKHHEHSTLKNPLA